MTIASNRTVDAASVLRTVVDAHSVDDLVDEVARQSDVLLRFLAALLFHRVARRVRP